MLDLLLLFSCLLSHLAGVATLTVRELFDFAVDPNITAANLDEALGALQHLAANRSPGGGDELDDSTEAKV